MPHLTMFLQNGRLEIDNNRSERAIKPFVIGRKIGSSLIR
ncbi:transposase [Sporosarcina sp. P19]